jgi:hypothetical protein
MDPYALFWDPPRRRGASIAGIAGGQPGWKLCRWSSKRCQFLEGNECSIYICNIYIHMLYLYTFVYLKSYVYIYIRVETNKRWVVASSPAKSFKLLAVVHKLCMYSNTSYMSQAATERFFVQILQGVEHQTLESCRSIKAAYRGSENWENTKNFAITWSVIYIYICTYLCKFTHM